MSHSENTTVIATYRVREDSEAAFLSLLRKHVPTLREVGLVAKDAPDPIVYRGAEQGGGLIFFEIFTWISPDAPEIAHQTPEVMKVWEAMGPLCEERQGRPKFEFPHVELLDPV